MSLRPLEIQRCNNARQTSVPRSFQCGFYRHASQNGSIDFYRTSLPQLMFLWQEMDRQSRCHTVETSEK